MHYWRLPKPNDPIESSLVATFDSLQDEFWEMLQSPFDVDAYFNDNACCLSYLHAKRGLQMVDDASVKLFDGDDVSESGYCSNFESDDCSASLFSTDKSVDDDQLLPHDKAAFDRGSGQPASMHRDLDIHDVGSSQTPSVDTFGDDEANWGFDLPIVKMDTDMTSYVKKAYERL
ncbi:hypothetical protein L7F22_038532 [Adiantum nelumboides]|nr:hypothetical protein [Adiantum nelumboides]